MRKHLIPGKCLAVGMIGTAAFLSAQTPDFLRPSCPLMDRSAESLFETGAAYLYMADVEKNEHSGKVGFLEIDAYANLAYFRWPFGDIDAGADMGIAWIVDTGDFDWPNQLFMARTPLTWIRHLPDGSSKRLTLKPGYYGDGETLDRRAFFMPVSFSVVRAFNENLCGVAGLEFRPRFERRWFPVFGAVWQPTSDLRVEALLPRGSLSLGLGRDWRVFAGYAWESLDYRLDDHRKQINVEDFRISLGATRVLSPELEVKTEIGYIAKRRLRFQRSEESRFNPDDTVFIRFALAAPF